jgi:hypothetical protein
MGEYEDRYPDAYGRDETSGQPTAREEVIHPAGPRQVRDPTVRVPEHPETPSGQPITRVAASYRGIGPRGYRRSPERIYEDVCDRLTDNPFIDASDIEVAMSGRELTLSGTVDSEIALSQTQRIAEEVAGVGRVHNRLRVRTAGGRGEATPGERVSRAMGTASTR